MSNLSKWNINYCELPQLVELTESLKEVETTKVFGYTLYNLQSFFHLLVFAKKVDDYIITTEIILSGHKILECFLPNWGIEESESHI